MPSFIGSVSLCLSGRSSFFGVVSLVLALSASAAPGDTAAVPEPSDYRLDNYRGPTPATVAGGQAIDTEEAASLWRDHRAVFVDVLPAPRRPEALSADTLWKPVPHRDIPGSLWLPETGRGALSSALEAYFTGSLEGATRGNKNTALVFYCLAHCWMSWNAAKRAAADGYQHVLWYRDGTDGWEGARLPTAENEPAPGRP
ncbi:MAG TPA: PQQ-dependent catabolism-associated CXXCW motif protein [Stellaceae bacterium]|nr:PQQ-dependent catabolism-associated CXXCW motif protein [Stellaceae bacterium]